MYDYSGIDIDVNDYIDPDTLAPAFVECFPIMRNFLETYGPLPGDSEMSETAFERVIYASSAPLHRTALAKIDEGQVDEVVSELAKTAVGTGAQGVGWLDSLIAQVASVHVRDLGEATPPPVGSDAKSVKGEAAAAEEEEEEKNVRSKRDCVCMHFFVHSPLTYAPLFSFAAVKTGFNCCVGTSNCCYVCSSCCTEIEKSLHPRLAARGSLRARVRARRRSEGFRRGSNFYCEEQLQSP